VTQYDVEAYQRLEGLIGQKLPEFPCEEDTVLVLLERVSEAQRLASKELREIQQSTSKGGKFKRGRGGDGDGDEGEDAASIVKNAIDKKKRSKRR